MKRIVLWISGCLAVVAVAGFFVLRSEGLFASQTVYQTDAGAIGGYDPVAYFEEGRAVSGSADFSLDWNGATWRFSSARHKALFAAEPERYAPQFGGYCAWAVSQGYTAKTDPEAFSIVDGRLYLNYDQDVRSEWDQDRASLIQAGQGNWPEVLIGQ